MIDRSPYQFQPFAMQKLSGPAGNWTHCQWPTAYGPLKLNLEDITSRQAEIAARALRGHEADCWRDAARWLERLEEDAYHAGELAELACQRLRQGDHRSALHAIRSAIQIERQYRPASSWQALHDQICQAAEQGEQRVAEQGEQRVAEQAAAEQRGQGEQRAAQQGAAD